MSQSLKAINSNRCKTCPAHKKSLKSQNRYHYVSHNYYAWNIKGAVGKERDEGGSKPPFEARITL